MSELVQPIAVTKNKGTHEDVVEAVAIASVRVWLENQDEPIWDEWLAGRFTKSVRRGTNAQVGLAEVEDPHSYVQVQEAQAIAFLPTTYEQMSAPLSKMQVTGLDRGRSDEWVNHDEGPTLWVNEALEMTTGKTAAQVAHGLFAWLLKLSPESRAGWVSMGSPLRIRSMMPNDFREVAAHSVVTIQDAGFTEIEPGSVTVLVTSEAWRMT